MGIEVRAGLHAGECELIAGKIGGVTVHVAARVAALSEPGEVLVSRTIKDLVAGSGIRFEERGSHALKGLPDPWSLYRAEV
jgi:class 3 adenylate cyclase